jgi:DNA-binding MarR family transcriptional regulator
MNKNDAQITSGLNKSFHEPARLAIMGSLLAIKKLTFTDLMNTHSLTRGNLSMHMKVLNELDYVMVNKSFIDKRPCTTYQLTEKGRSEFIAYIESLEDILKNIRKQTEVNSRVKWEK